MKVRVEKRFAFSAVPDALLEDKRLSLSARAVLGWMLGRPPGWKITPVATRVPLEVLPPRRSKGDAGASQSGEKSRRFACETGAAGCVNRMARGWLCRKRRVCLALGVRWSGAAPFAESTGFQGAFYWYRIFLALW